MFLVRFRCHRFSRVTREEWMGLKLSTGAAACDSVRMPRVDWNRRSWSEIQPEHRDFASKVLRIFQEELRIHFIAHGADFDHRPVRQKFEDRMVNLVRSHTGKLVEVLECILRDQQHGSESPPHTIKFGVGWDEETYVTIELNDRMTLSPPTEPVIERV